MSPHSSREPSTREPSDAWLRAADARCRAADISPSRRAWFAVKDYAAQHGRPLEQGDPVVERIFSWFRDHSD